MELFGKAILYIKINMIYFQAKFFILDLKLMQNKLKNK